VGYESERERLAIFVSSDNRVLDITLSSRSRVLCLTRICGQASESMWGMPGHREAMKAVVSCDKPRGAAHTH
jgi:hypothetical protein